MMVRVIIPFQLQTLAQTGQEVELDVGAPVTLRGIMAALERRYPMLQGAIIDHNTGQRRPRLRFFACSEDWSFEAVDQPLPEDIQNGKEPFLIVGAISGG